MDFEQLWDEPEAGIGPRELAREQRRLDAVRANAGLTAEYPGLAYRNVLAFLRREREKAEALFPLCGTRNPYDSKGAPEIRRTATGPLYPPADYVLRVALRTCGVLKRVGLGPVKVEIWLADRRQDQWKRYEQATWQYDYRRADNPIRANASFWETRADWEAWTAIFLSKVTYHSHGFGLSMTNGWWPGVRGTWYDAEAYTRYKRAIRLALSEGEGE